MADTITTGVADVGVPFFVTTIFVLSYLFWTKFRHGGKLRIDFDSPNAVDSVAEVLLIFTTLLLTFVEMPLAFATLGAVRDIDLGVPRINNIWTGTTSTVVVLGCLAIVILLATKLHERPHPTSISSFLRIVAGIHGFIVSIILGLWASAFLHATPSLLKQQLFVLSIALLMISYASCVPLYFLSNKIPSKPLKYGQHVIITICLVGGTLGLAFGILSSPTYHQAAPVVTEYYIAQQWSAPDAPTAAAALTEITVNLKNTGNMGTYFHLAEIRYETIALQHRDGTDFMFALKTVDNRGNRVDLANGVDTVAHYDAVPDKHGILRIRDDKNKSVIFWFDRDTLAEENITGLTLQAAVDVQLNASQYERSSSTTCNDQHRCKTIVNISNSLDAPVLDRNYFITTLRTLNVNASACQFLNISSHTSLVDPRGLFASCSSPNDCDLESHGQALDVNIDIALADGNINVRYARLQRPVNVSITLDVQC